MQSLIEQISDWTEARWPETIPFLAGLGTGLLGLGALAILTVGLAPAKLVTLMPLWLCICGASGGYSLWQKRRRGASKTLPLLTTLLAIVLAGVGGGVQYMVEQSFFEPQIRPTVLVVFVAAAIFGTALGGWLRIRYENAYTSG